MAETAKVWFDREADYLEVVFASSEGFFEETESDAVMRKVDSDGNVLGFSILNVSALKTESPLSVSLDKRTA